MNELSPTTKALLQAARQDGPTAVGRSQIWKGVAAKGAGKVALGAAGGKAAASAATAKLFVMGALLGSAITVGVAAMVLHVGSPTLRNKAAINGDLVQSVARPVPAHADTETAAPAAGTNSATVDEAPPPPAHADPVRHSAGHSRLPGDSLAHEARLVEEARGAIMRGQPDVALNALRAARALPDHALEPEELSLEVRALRALGRLDEANAADARLKARFPDHALAR